MAHIATLMVESPASLAVGMNNYIARELSPHPPHDSTTEASLTDEKEKYVWRMHQPTEPRKYQLFPAREKLSIAGGQKNAEAEPSQSTGTGENGTNEKDRSTLGTGLRIKKEQPLIRRRKTSITELGPMTTVQEIAMDSPTIPGRPPLHERSISAPGNSWRQHPFGESMLSCISGPLLDENAELAISTDSGNTGVQANVPGESEPPPHFTTTQTRSASPKVALSPKSLAPLVIPTPSRLTQQSSQSRLRSVSEGTPPDVPPKPTRMDGSPHPRASPYTPMSSSSLSLLSASTAPTSTSTTPNSALPMPSYPIEGRSSPKPMGGTSNSAPMPSPMGHMRGQSDAPTQRTLIHQRSFPVYNQHRRHESESGASIMDRGRPKKRSQTPVDGSPIKRSPSKSKQSPSKATTTTSKSTSPTAIAGQTNEMEKSEEQKAFEHLPTGIRATEASTRLPISEIATLRKQAIGQASRFEVLSSKDVEALSRELRALDERCEYLRKTHRSLRSGRRNLHERICTYLRSPRVARFSHESMLKQEEALKELDSSIDDWVSKLEVAENRRTRVRQKLLEHVAAALIIQPIPCPDSGMMGGNTSPFNPELEKEMIKNQVLNMVDSTRDPNTPPRSPTKSSSPERLERAVEELKITSPEAPARRGGRDVESIRIYADSDVYALMADLDEEINRMGEQERSDAREREREQKEVEQKKEDTIAAGLTLNAVTFEGMAVHHQRMRTPELR